MLVLSCNMLSLTVSFHLLALQTLVHDIDASITGLAPNVRHVDMAMAHFVHSLTILRRMSANVMNLVKKKLDLR